jgi:hypothetical protein
VLDPGAARGADRSRHHNARLTLAMTLTVHIVAGGLGLLSGGVALYAAKGALLHRRSGMVFVVAMLTMTFTGTVIAVFQGVAPGVNVPAALLTAYLVITSLMTVRPPAQSARGLAIGALLVVACVAVICLAFGVEAIAGGGRRKGIPAFPFFLFGIVGVLAAVGDVRVIRNGALRGAHRLARHLWRMCFALFIAAMSFFIGQADEIPEPLRIPALLAAPVVAVLVTMLYWMWRIRVRRTLRGLVMMRAAETA